MLEKKWGNTYQDRGPTLPESLFRGVRWNKKRGKWIAELKISGKVKYLGLFDDDEDAARAYDRGAREAGQTNAILNFPDDA